jgi:hypothetical protein
MNGCKIALSDDVVVAVLTCVALLVLFALVAAVIIAVAVVVEDFVALYESAVSFVSGVVVVALLDDDSDDVAVSTVNIALGVVGAAAAGIACTAVAFLALSHHFFLGACLPCPGPGMLTSEVVMRLGLS